MYAKMEERDTGPNDRAEQADTIRGAEQERLRLLEHEELSEMGGAGSE
jgi:hypothetical protein